MPRVSSTGKYRLVLRKKSRPLVLLLLNNQSGYIIKSLVLPVCPAGDAQLEQLLNPRGAACGLQFRGAASSACKRLHLQSNFSQFCRAASPPLHVRYDLPQTVAPLLLEIHSSCSSTDQGLRSRSCKYLTDRLSGRSSSTTDNTHVYRGSWPDFLFISLRRPFYAFQSSSNSAYLLLPTPFHEANPSI